MTDLLDGIGLLLLTAGCFFALTAGIAQQRFPDVAARAHAAAKPQVLGLILVLCGVAVTLRQAQVTAMALVAIVFQLATSPVGSHMVARSAYRYGHLDTDAMVVDDVARDLATGALEVPAGTTDELGKEQSPGHSPSGPGDG